MLSREENDSLPQTGSGKPLGLLMRRYWLPELLSAETRHAKSRSSSSADN